MSKRFIRSINYMRGLCMLGVIGIHVGSAALSNPTPNLALIGLLEILSRFSVPAFFFLSAFGMFCSQPLSAPFDYGAYLKRRLKTVLLPYITWSFFYMLYTAVLSRNFGIFSPSAVFKTLTYGLAMYHIYFLVILLWFYLLMPLWRRLLAYMLKAPFLSFSILFLANLAFNFCSSYLFTYTGTNDWLKDAASYRLNWVVFHYIFIFMFGAFAAEKFEAVTAFLSHHGKGIILFQVFSAAAMVASYIGVMHVLHYDALGAVYTVHQLSPVGMIYTLSSILFFLYLWQCRPVSVNTDRLFSFLGDKSYLVYLVHPVFLSLCTGTAAHFGIVLSALPIILIYIFVTVAAATCAAFLQNLPLPRFLAVCLRGK